MSGCCAPTRDPDDGNPHVEKTHVGNPHVGNPANRAPADGPADERGRGDAGITFVALPGGRYEMGERSEEWFEPLDGEEPVEAHVAPFELAATSVTNDQFAAFVEATGHVTDAERYGWSFVFGGLLPDDFPDTRGVVGAEWWRQVHGASWRHPDGPQSDLDDRGDHPVLHVSHDDALAFTRWSGTRLPTEAEWELAGKAGSAATWPWGHEREPGGRHVMNVFQGVFPGGNTMEDGWRSTCPVHAFEPNAFGLWNMIGNVWEWTADAFLPPQRHVPARRDAPILLKGGSYLCHDSYCRRYRPAARMGSSADSSSGNVGFRVAR